MRIISTKNAIVMVAGIVACTASLSQAALTAWTGAVSGDWNDDSNWTNNKPATYADGGVTSISGASNGVTINGSLPQQPTSNIPTAFDALQTPNMTLSNGATLSLVTLRGNGGTGKRGGEIANVSGTGSHLTLTGRNGTEFQLSREADGTEVWNVSNGGTVSLIASGRTDMGFNQNRLTQINLDNGTFNVGGTDLWGTRNNRSLFTATMRNEVTLDQGSLFNASTAYFSSGNMYSGDNYTSFATLNFDIKDENSAVRFRAGSTQGIFGDAANIENAFGTMFTSSTLGDENLVATDLGSNVWEVTVTVPEPASLGLIAMGVALIAVRRKSKA